MAVPVQLPVASSTVLPQEILMPPNTSATASTMTTPFGPLGSLPVMAAPSPLQASPGLNFMPPTNSPSATPRAEQSERIPEVLANLEGAHLALLKRSEKLHKERLQLNASIRQAKDEHASLKQQAASTTASLQSWQDGVDALSWQHAKEKGQISKEIEQLRFRLINEGYDLPSTTTPTPPMPMTTMPMTTMPTTTMPMSSFDLYDQSPAHDV
uniref:Uncharacterized protein n=1 Tax=Eutreptiella gymnastica TaxID=73025 RepID=A0A7S1I009_9EUGL